MKVWDLHCDTLSALRNAEKAGAPKRFAQNDLMIDLDRLQKGDYLLQCFACFVELKQEADPLVAVLEEIDLFYRLLGGHPELMQVKSPADIARLAREPGRIGAMLTVEEGGVCKDSIGVLRDLYRLGVRMMTLTWNYPNGLAQPNVMPGYHEDTWPRPANTTGGVTETGLAFLAEMERLRMLVDVSHLSDAGFWDVVRHTRRPFVASHSNARALCPHVRNLTDDMLRAMAERGGLVGLNYCGAFLNPTADRRHTPSRVADMVRHVQHMIQVGGEDLVALGSDFDGIGGELELSGADQMPRLAQALLDAGLHERMVEKIFWRNALEFYSNNL